MRALSRVRVALVDMQVLNGVDIVCIYTIPCSVALHVCIEHWRYIFDLTGCDRTAALDSLYTCTSTRIVALAEVSILIGLKYRYIWSRTKEKNFPILTSALL